MTPTIFSNIFSETTRQIDLKFGMESPQDGGTKYDQMVLVTRTRWQSLIKCKTPFHVLQFPYGKSPLVL